MATIENDLITMEMTYNIESDLEYLYDKINDRQSILSQLLKENSDEYVNSVTNKREEQLKTAINRNIDMLIKEMNNECYSESNSVLKSLKKVQNEGLMHDDWTFVCKELKNTMEEIRPFDIKTMLNLYKETENSGKELIDRDIILLLGHTGAGM